VFLSEFICLWAKRLDEALECKTSFGRVQEGGELNFQKFSQRWKVLNLEWKFFIETTKKCYSKVHNKRSMYSKSQPINWIHTQNCTQ